MRKLTMSILAALVIAAATAGIIYSQAGGSHHTVTQAEYDKWKKDLSNWGRWGKDDEIGALNLITPAKRKQAAALVKDGVSVTLGHEAITEKSADATSPYEIERQVGEVAQLYRARGCPHCRNLGYSGRIGIYELFIPDDMSFELISTGASLNGMREMARAAGMKTLGIDATLRTVEPRRPSARRCTGWTSGGTRLKRCALPFSGCWRNCARTSGCLST